MPGFDLKKLPEEAFSGTTIYFLPLVLPLMTLLTGEFEPKVGALVHVSLIESIFVRIAGSTGMQLKKSSTISQNAIGAKRLL